MTANSYWESDYPIDLKREIDPDRFEAETRWQTGYKLHRFLMSKIDHHSSERVLPPVELLETRKGDCGDTCVFSASVLHILRIPFRIRAVWGQGDKGDSPGHGFTQFLVEEKPLKSYPVHLEEVEDGYWISIDPFFQNRLGELDPFLGKFIDSESREYFEEPEVLVERGKSYFDMYP